MSTSNAESTLAGRLGRLAEPLTEVKDKLAGVVGDAQDHLVGARDGAGGAIAENPFRWTLAAFVAGVVLGAMLGSRRGG